MIVGIFARLSASATRLAMKVSAATVRSPVLSAASFSCPWWPAILGPKGFMTRSV